MASYSRRMTVANIRENAQPEAVVVTFLESARFFRLQRTNPAFLAVLESLREAVKTQKPLDVKTPSIDSDIIEHVL